MKNQYFSSPLYDHSNLGNNFSQVQYFGAHVIQKTNLNQKQMNNYFLLQDLRIGVDIEKLNQSTIIMASGISLQKYLKYQRPFPSISNQNILKQLQVIRQILIDNHLAHCDIKVQNFVIYNVNSISQSLILSKQFFNSKLGKKIKIWSQKFVQPQLLLIDADDMVKFGQMRTCGHIGLNCTELAPEKGQITSEKTDVMGFDRVKEIIRNSKQIKEI